MKTLLLIAGWLWLVAPARATIFTVPRECGTIQEAIDVARSGDEVLIAPGVYRGLGNYNLDFHGKAITVRSETGDAESCIINCQYYGRGFYFHHGEGRDAVIAGLTIKNGYGPQDEDFTLDDFALGYLHHGGGILCRGICSPTIIDCRFITNEAGDYGGAVCALDGAAPLVVNCEMWSNSADSGGGVYARGGAMIMVINSLMVGNYARWTGGVGYARDNSPLVFWSCTSYDNRADYYGGGVLIWASALNVRDSIFWDNLPDEIAAGESIVEVSYSDIDGGWPGEENMNLLPWFTRGPLGDFYLSQVAAGQRVDSPCLDAGSGQASDLEFATVAGTINLGRLTTRADEISDTGPVDIGVHHEPWWLRMMPILTQVPEMSAKSFQGD